MKWDDHYTTHKFQGLFLIQTERYLQTELNSIHAKKALTIIEDIADEDDIDDGDDESTNIENNDEEQF
ncbi:unnamed protein product [Adineta ricciae]|uniref:Uncharacterized protein n=1 Tax=Adineta ricciae TaxID=249248 RepID=A0A815W498_ADIRI|nr:unnamed protein product [Adineta ricciae]